MHACIHMHKIFVLAINKLRILYNPSPEASGNCRRAAGRPCLGVASQGSSGHRAVAAAGSLGQRAAVAIPRSPLHASYGECVLVDFSVSRCTPRATLELRGPSCIKCCQTNAGVVRLLLREVLAGDGRNPCVRGPRLLVVIVRHCGH